MARQTRRRRANKDGPSPRSGPGGGRAARRAKPDAPSSQLGPGPAAPAPLAMDPAGALEFIRLGLGPDQRFASAATTLSRVVGNRAVSRLLAEGKRPVHDGGLISRLGDGSSTLDTYVEEIYESLNWTNEVPRLYRALRAAHPRWEEVQSAFRDEHGSIWTYLKDQLSTEQVIEAYALLMHGHAHDLHVGLARAILPIGTRDAEIHRILGSVPAGRRSELARQYERDYNDLGEGTLRADLIDDQSGWELEKSLALLDHDLTEAEQLYFDSVAIVGTHTSDVVARLQRIAGDNDPNKMAEFEDQWNRYVKGSSGWSTGPPEQFTDMDLRSAMVSELSGEDAGFALAAIDRGRRRGTNAAGAVPAEGAAPGASVLSEEQGLEDENIRLRMHEDYINAAAEGLGTNEQQIFDAVEAIRQIWDGRIRRARAAENPGLVTQYENDWRTTQNRIRPIVNDEMDESGVENLRVRLLLAGALTPADKLYLAKEDFDNDAAVAAVTEAYLAGQIGQLTSQAREARADTDGTTIRPSFDPLFSVPVTSGLPFRRIAVLLNSDWSDARRGAERLKLELDDGSADSDCQRAVDFLKDQGLAGSRRSAIIQAFNGLQGLGDRQEETPEQRFLGWLAERYENSNATWAMRDLVDPTSDPDELLSRARGRHDAAHSGIMDHVLNDFARDWGHLTGEDTVEVEAEALARLEFIVRSRTTPSELEGMLALTGKSSVEELASFQYSEYITRLEELRSLKATIAEGLATAVEVLAAAVLTIVTGGAAGGALVVAIGSALAGMVAREMLLGTDYELFSEENAKQLIIAAVTAGVGEYIGPAVEGLEAIERLGTAGAFVRGALSEGAKAISSETLSTIMSERMPTVESLSASALRVLGNSLGGGVSARLSVGVDRLPIDQQILPAIRANVASTMVSGVVDEASQLTSGTGNLTATDIAGRFGLRLGRGLAEGTVGAFAEVGARDVAASRAAGGGESDTDTTGDADSEVDAGTPDGSTAGTEGETTGDPEAAGAAALTNAQSQETDDSAGGAGGGGPGGGGHEPPGGGGGDGGDDRLLPGLTADEVDQVFAGATSGPLDSAEAPGRSPHATLVGPLDRSQPMEASGFEGSLAGGNEGYGAFEQPVRTARGDEVPAVVKVFPPDNPDGFRNEMAGAAAAAVTGIGPPFYGEVDVPGDLAFAMGPVPGGFLENMSLADESSPQYARAQAEADAANAAVSPQAAADVRSYGDALLHLGHHYDGELQGLIGPDGRWRPIDFAGIGPLPTDPDARRAAIEDHRNAIGREVAEIEAAIADREATGGAGSSSP